MSTHAESFTIGQLADRCGVPVRTVRFWSDAGLLPPADRSAAGYRRYDVTAVARLDLIQTLRELGFGLDLIQELLARVVSLAEVAATGVAALDAEIRTLRLRRAVLSAVANRAITVEEVPLMHKLARLSAQERQHIIDEFVQNVVEGVGPDAPAMGIARSMRTMPAELPDDPAPEQVDAWIELGELVADEDFRARVRAMVAAGERTDPGVDHTVVTELAGRALAEGIAPDSAEGKAIAARIVPAERRAAVRAQLETFTDTRVERYWQLLAIVNGHQPWSAVVPSFEWLIAALR